jgi:hypothetical protein
VEWAADHRLTDDNASRNGWLLEVASKTLLDWCELLHPDGPGKDEPPHNLEWGGIHPPYRMGQRTEVAPKFRRRNHEEPPSDSDLGPLARDFVWLAHYVFTDTPRAAFAPNDKRSTVVQQVRKAADLIDLELPEPLRPT